MKLPDWRGATVVAIASGPSLTPQDLELVRVSSRPTIVTNSTLFVCPWADAVFAFDLDWQNRYRAELKAFPGRRFTQSIYCRPPMECARRDYRFRSFGNSGANAVSLAIVAGASRVVMLGFDCALTGGRSHHHGDHPRGLRNCETLSRWPEQFLRLSLYAARAGATVVNASRVSALDCFPKVSLDDELDVGNASAAISRPAGASAGSGDAGVRAAHD